jgi:hypothetical protein
LPSPPAP